MAAVVDCGQLRASPSCSKMTVQLRSRGNNNRVHCEAARPAGKDIQSLRMQRLQEASSALKVRKSEKHESGQPGGRALDMSSRPPRSAETSVAHGCSAERGTNQQGSLVQTSPGVFPEVASGQCLTAAKRQCKHQARAVAPMRRREWRTSCRSSHTS